MTLLSGKRVLLTVSGVHQRIEARIMHHIRDELRTAGVATEVLQVGRPSDFLQIRTLAESDVVVIHSPFLMALVPAFIARYILGRPLIGIQWDCYPVTLGGQRYDRRTQRKLMDLVEGWVLRQCDQIFVPSADFLGDPRLAQAEVVPLWYPIATGRMASGDPDQEVATDLRVIFAGQVNATRGLTEAVEALDLATDGRFILQVASGDSLPADLADHPRVQCLGFLPPAELQRAILACDCGLVSLARNFDGPGFPSKTFDYLQAGVPCLYHGKALSNYLRVMQDTGVGIDLNGQQRGTLTRASVATLRRGLPSAVQRFSAVFKLDPAAFIQAMERAIS